MAKSSDGSDRVLRLLSGLERVGAEHGFQLAYRDRKEVGISHVLTILDGFMDVVRYSNNRRSGTSTISIQSEDDVQDALYFMLKPLVRDLIYEVPGSKEGNRFVIKDFRSRALRCAIEAKYIRSKDHGKSISKELHDDIEMYARDPDVHTVVFFVYDPESNIPDADELRRHIEVDRTIDQKSISVHLKLKP
jgi:hypothetical protein